MPLQLKAEKFNDQSILSHFLNLNLDREKKCCVLKLINYSNKLRGLLQITRRDVYITQVRPPSNWLLSIANSPIFYPCFVLNRDSFVQWNLNDFGNIIDRRDI